MLNYIQYLYAQIPYSPSLDLFQALVGYYCPSLHTFRDQTISIGASYPSECYTRYCRTAIRSKGCFGDGREPGLAVEEGLTRRLYECLVYRLLPHMHILHKILRDQRRGSMFVV
jgi:hypothetical protein